MDDAHSVEVETSLAAKDANLKMVTDKIAAAYADQVGLGFMTSTFISLTFYSLKPPRMNFKTSISLTVLDRTSRRSTFIWL